MSKFVIIDNRYDNINLVVDNDGITKEYNTEEEAKQDLIEYPDGVIIELD